MQQSNISGNSYELQTVAIALFSKLKIHWANIESSSHYSSFEPIRINLNINNARQFLYHIIHDIETPMQCICGSYTNWHTRTYLQYCSLRCSTVATAENRTHTMLERYNVCNYSKSNEFKTKSKHTFIQHYGVDNPSKLPAIQDKKISTSLTKYGVPNYSQLHLSDKTVSIINDKDAFAAFAKDKTILQVANGLGMSYSGPIKLAEKYKLTDIFAASIRSSYEEKVAELLDSLGIDYIANSKSIISPLQLDFYIPSAKMAIEVGSMYFHCELSHKKSKMYHYNKWKCCHDQGITLLQYFDDDISHHWNVISATISRVCNTLPDITSEKLAIITAISSEDEQIFLDRYHINGFNCDRNTVYAASYKDTIVAVLSLNIIDSTATIIRYALHDLYQLPDLFPTMLNSFISNADFTGDITGVSDNRHGMDDMYISAGFISASSIEPRCEYTKNYLFREYDHLDTYDDIELEYNIMQLRGFDRLWNAGFTKWILPVK